MFAFRAILSYCEFLRILHVVDNPFPAEQNSNLKESALADLVCRLYLKKRPVCTMTAPASEPSQAAYSRGYSADVDKIREQEYPNLNGMSTPFISSIG